MSAQASPTIAATLPRRAPGGLFNMASYLVDRHVEEGHGDRIALHSADRSLTYAELQQLANLAGNVLRGLGVQSEQRVALQLPDCVEFVATFLGAMKIGAVPVPLNTAAAAADLRFFLADSHARVLVTTPQLATTNLDSSAADLPDTLGAIVLVGGTMLPGELQDRCIGFEQAIARASSTLTPFPTGADEPCYWLYSSGTTGRPKGVVHLHGDMLACVVPYAEEVVGIVPEDRTYSAARLFFSYGLVNALFLPLVAGASAVLVAERPLPATILRVTRMQRPTLLFAVPTSYAQLCASLAAEPSEPSPLASVRLAITAGEALTESLYRRWHRLTGIELLDGLGSTEVGYIFCSNRPGQVRPGSSGRPIGDHQLKLIDEDGREIVTPGVRGELWVRAASTALQYWNQRGRTKATFIGEWLRTGDGYRRDADGYFWYEGRTDDLFKVSGQWVSPLEVENCLLEHPAVVECAVVGAADDAGLIKPKAFVVRQPGTSVTGADLQQQVRQRLLPHKYPRWVIFVEELPKTATGKVQRFRLREL